MRFLRSLLDLSQSSLARIIGASRATVARWEGEPDARIPGASDRALRMFIALKASGNEHAGRLVELLQDLDEREHASVVFEEAAGAWRRRPEGLAATWDRARTTLEFRLPGDARGSP